MKEDTIVDYAMPLMNIERAAKQIHDLCLEHKYEEAKEETVVLLVEARLLQSVLDHMKEKACPTSPPASA